MPTGRRIALLLRSQLTPLLILIVSIMAITLLLARHAGDQQMVYWGSALSIVGIALPLVLIPALVTRDLSSGMAQLWFQKPVSPVRFYLARFCEAMGASVLLLLLLVIAVRLGSMPVSVSREPDVLIWVPRLLLASVLVGAISFGISAWLNRGVVIATLAVFATGMLIENDLYVRLQLDGGGWALLALLFFPESALDAIWAFSSGRSDAIWQPLIRILGYGGVWVAIGALGVRRTLRQGGITRAPDG